MSQDELIGEYFEWLYRIVAPPGTPTYMSYRKLLKYLHTIDFRVIVDRDQNRAEDGKTMRYHFALDQTTDHRDILAIEDELEGPCSVLEMMVALAVKCENFMDDTNYGNRTSQWFWTMIINLGLGPMIDNRFDYTYVDEKIDIFLDRRYAPDGRGGLFTVPNPHRDLRDVEIWHQMCWYLNTIT